jgi:hypothetical protein
MGSKKYWGHISTRVQFKERHSQLILFTGNPNNIMEYKIYRKQTSIAHSSSALLLSLNEYSNIPCTVIKINIIIHSFEK